MPSSRRILNEGAFAKVSSDRRIKHSNADMKEKSPDKRLSAMASYSTNNLNKLNSKTNQINLINNAKLRNSALPEIINLKKDSFFDSNEVIPEMLDEDGTPWVGAPNANNNKFNFD